jgi:hypothetical protein
LPILQFADLKQILEPDARLLLEAIAFSSPMNLLDNRAE